MKLPKLIPLKCSIIVCVLLLFVAGWVSQIVAQNDAGQISIIGFDEEKFPDITATIRSVDSNNKISQNLAERDLSIYENEQQVASFTLTKIPDPAPANVVFILDLGQYFDFDANAIKSLMFHFVEGGYFRDGTDSIAILVRVNNTPGDRTETLLPLTSSASEFLQVVDSINVRPANREIVTDGLKAVESGLDLLLDPQSRRDNSTIIYISRLIQHPGGRTQEQIIPDAQNLATSAAEQGVTIYTFHASRNLGQADALLALSDMSGGEYVPLFVGQDNRRSLNSAYQTIINQGVRYQVSYRSQLGTSSDRTVAIVPAGVPPSAASNTLTYNVPLQPPNVRIVSSGDGQGFNFNRNPTRDESGERWVYDLNSIDIVAEVTWPDGIPRAVTSVVLLAAESGTEIFTIPNPSEDRFVFTWDITDITTEGVHLYPIQVQIVDELGIVSNSQSQAVRVEVFSGTEVTTEIISQPVPGDPCLINPDSSECEERRREQAIFQASSTGLIAAAIAIALLVLALFKARNELKKLSPDGSMRGAVNVVKTKIFGGEGAAEQPLARLHIEIARSELEGEAIDVHNQKLTIGRDPEQCDVILYPLQQESSVSRKHCTIQYDQGRFLITHHSSSITTINNRRIRSGLPIPLNDGDMIVLGQIAVKGARLRFEQLIESESATENGSSSWPTDIYEGSTNDIDPFDEIPDLNEHLLDDNWLSDKQE